MKVYEMIQELTKYDADQEVEINVVADGYSTTVEVDEDVKDGEETDVDIDFDEDVTEFDVDEYKKYNGQKLVRISVELS